MRLDAKATQRTRGMRAPRPSSPAFISIALLLPLAAIARLQRAQDEYAVTSSPTYSSIKGALRAVGPGNPLNYEDNFDLQSKFEWTMFEEIVNSCAVPGTGNVTRTTQIKYSGTGGLVVSSNAGRVAGTNHVLAQRKLADVGIPGGKFVYSVFFYVDPDVLPLTQTGPELSLQNNLPVAIDLTAMPPKRTWRTQIAGIQYVGNKWVPEKWKVWSAVGNGAEPGSETSMWVNVDKPTLPALEEKGWWQMTMTADFGTMRYASLDLKSPSGAMTSVSMEKFRIANEVRFTEGSFGATLEAENLYDCPNNGVWVHDMYYDNVKIEQQSGVVPTRPEARDLSVTMKAGETEAFSVQELGSDADGNLASISILAQPDLGSAIVQNGVLTYSAGLPGGAGIKFMLCDDTFLCDEAWITISVRQ